MILSVLFCIFSAKSAYILHPCLSVSESTVLGYSSCGTPILSFARGRQTLAAKTHAWDWYFECTSTSPTAGQCPCRLPPTPLNAVSHRCNAHSGKAFQQQRTKLGFFFSFLFVIVVQETERLGVMSCWIAINTSSPVRWALHNQMAMDALYLMPNTHAIDHASHWMTEGQSFVLRLPH